MGSKANMRQELDRKYVKQLDTGDTDGLRNVYTHYRDTCIEGGGSAAWARATSVLVLELLERLEKAQHECPWDCDSCHGWDCTCDRMGCKGSGVELDA